MTELNAKTFDALAHLQARTYPKDTVTVHSDAEALYQYLHINTLANDAADGVEANEYDKLLDELRKQIQASALTFHLQGFPPYVMQAIMTEARGLFKLQGDEMILEKTEPFRWVNLKTIAVSIKKIVNAAGEEDERVFTVEDVEGFEGLLIPEDFNKLADKTFELSLSAMMFDAAVSPDF